MIPQQPGNTRRRWFAGLAALGGLGLLGAQAQAHGWGRRRRLDPEEMARRLDWRIGRLVQEAGGTPAAEGPAGGDRHRGAGRPSGRCASRCGKPRRAGLDLLAAPVIDRRALEQLRATQMQVADARSRRMVQAMADAAEVLTPEQRVKVAERLKQRMDRRWHG